MSCPDCDARLPWQIGAEPAPAAGIEKDLTKDDFQSALRQLTPSLLIVGIATGAAFAIGSGLVSRYLFTKK